MENDISFVRVSSGAAAALALLLAACASAPPQETVTEAAPAEPVTEPAEPAPVADAEEVRLKSDAPLRYIVKKGDTLWAIATHFLQDPWQWPELWYVNTQVRNPHLIYPGDELLLYWVNGRPLLARAGEGPEGGTGEQGPAEPADFVPPGGTETFGPRVRELPLDQAIYTIPIEAIRAFLRGPRFVERRQLSDAPYVASFDEGQMMAGADSVAYVLDLDEQPEPRPSQYQIVRRGREFRDPDDNDVIGYEAIPVAESEVRTVGDPSVVYLARSDIETRIGDHLLPVEPDPLLARYVPRAPPKAVDGKVIHVYNGMSQIGQFQVVTLNRGTEHGLEPGHVLTVYQSGRKVEDPRSWYGRRVQLPDTKAGTVMVFKTTDRASYALVVTALRPIHLLDRVEKPEIEAP